MKEVKILVKNNLSNYRKVNSILNSKGLQYKFAYNDGLEYVIQNDTDIDIEKLISKEVKILSIK